MYRVRYTTQENLIFHAHTQKSTAAERLKLFYPFVLSICGEKNCPLGFAVEMFNRSSN